jgi:hypothetical protein
MIGRMTRMNAAVAEFVAALACRAIFPAESVAQAALGIPFPAAWVTTPTLVSEFSA